MLVNVIARRLRVVGHDEDRRRTPLRRMAQVLDDLAERAIAVGDFLRNRRDVLVGAPVVAVVGR